MAKELKDLIRNRRKETGKTLEEVAQLVGVAKATVQRWESGAIKEIRRDKIVKLPLLNILWAGLNLNGKRIFLKTTGTPTMTKCA